MIATIIVGGSIALAVVFFAVWMFRPGWRRAIEAPKHSFAARVRQYDRGYVDDHGNGRSEAP